MTTASGEPTEPGIGAAAAPLSGVVRLALAGAMALLAVYCGFIALGVDEAKDFVQRYGYTSIALTFVWFLATLVPLQRAIRDAVKSPSRREWVAVVALIVGCVVVGCLTVPYSYKVLYDEFVLQSTALHMHQAREVGASVRAYEVEGTFRSIGTYLDKRPVFFAFLVSLLHDVTGYREGNAFALNTALFPVVLALAYLLGRRIAGHLAGLVGVAGLGAFSLMAHNATGAGMEMLNLAMLLGVTLLATHYLAHPDGPRLAALLLATVLLAQTRYESGLYVGPVAIVVLEGWRRAGRLLLPWAAIVTPLLLIPYALHQTYLAGSPQLWELREGESTRFGLQYLAGNLDHALKFFFNFSGSMPNSWWLALAGVPALSWLGWTGLRRAREWHQADAAMVAGGVMAAAVSANLGLLMCYYWGQLDDPIASRLSLPFCAVMALAIGCAVARLPVAWRRAAVPLALGGAMLSYFSTGLRANATHGDMNALMKEIAWETDYVAGLPPRPRLILSNKSALAWIVRETPSIPLARARWRAPAVQFHLDHHTFQEVLVTQRLMGAESEGAYQVHPRDRLPANYVLEPLAERHFSGHLARISRVKEIRLDDATPGMQALEQP